jgi:hypothetical protein
VTGSGAAPVERLGGWLSTIAAAVTRSPCSSRFHPLLCAAASRAPVAALGTRSVPGQWGELHPGTPLQFQLPFAVKETSVAGVRAATGTHCQGTKHERRAKWKATPECAARPVKKSKPNVIGNRHCWATLAGNIAGIRPSKIGGKRRAACASAAKPF